jgi:fructokinase
MLAQILKFRVFDDALNETALNEIVRFANACGALATQKPGAIPALPTQHEVEHLLTSY